MEKIKEFLANFSLQKLIPGVLIFFIGLFVRKALVKLFDRALAKSKVDKSLHGFLHSLFNILMWFILILIVASSFGIDVTSLIAMLSVVSLALSLSVQDALSNIAGGIMVLTAHPFKVGDWVELGNGNSGSVLSVGLVYTKLQTVDNKIVNVPNSIVATTSLTNYSTEEKRRVCINVSASYDCAVEDVKAALTEAAKLDSILTDEEIFVRVNSYRENDIEYVIRVWTKCENYWTAYFGLMENIKKVFDQKNIKMSYPHTIVHLEK